jgi:hypothetical protein
LPSRSLAALVVLPIAWRDETLGDTWRFALRTIRLFCPAWIIPTTLWAVTASDLLPRPSAPLD